MAQTLTYETELTGKGEKGRLELAWDTAVPLHDSKPLPHVRVTAGVEMELDAPFGVSGGGIWRVRRNQKGEIWSPTSHAKLIGVQGTHEPSLKRVYAESVVLWGRWLQEIVGRFDGVLPVLRTKRAPKEPAKRRGPLPKPDHARAPAELISAPPLPPTVPRCQAALTPLSSGSRWSG